MCKAFLQQDLQQYGLYLPLKQPQLLVYFPNFPQDPLLQTIYHPKTCDTVHFRLLYKKYPYDLDYKNMQLVHLLILPQLTRHLTTHHSNISAIGNFQDLYKIYQYDYDPQRPQLERFLIYPLDSPSLTIYCRPTKYGTIHDQYLLQKYQLCLQHKNTQSENLSNLPLNTPLQTI